MLVKIDAFFREHEIRYYLLGGSTIGALRHHGFIPWDDDADLMMDRVNYYKLLDCIDEWPHKDIEFSCIERNPEWYRTIAQFSSLTNTIYQKSLVFNRGLSLGTKIDLMILDFVPNDKTAQYQKDFLLYQEASNFVFTYCNYVGDYPEEFEAVMKRMESKGRRAVLLDLKSKLEAYSPEESDKLAVRFWGKISKKLRFFEADWFGEPRYEQFENLMLPIPSRAPACLRYQYGFDWYRVPAVSAAHTHTYFMNWDVPGIEYHKHLSQYLDFDALDALSTQRKRANVQKLQYKRSLDEAKAEIAWRRALMDIDFNKVRDIVAQNSDWSHDREVANAMKPVWNSRKTIQLVPPQNRCIPDDLIDAWILALIRLGRCYEAEKAYTMCKGGFTTPMDAYQGMSPTATDFPAVTSESDVPTLLDSVLRLVCAYQDDDYPALSKLVDSFSDDLRNSIPDITLSLIKLKNNGFEVRESWGDLSARCDAHYKANPDNYDILMAKANLLNSTDPEKAMDLYRTVNGKTANGLDLLFLEENLGFDSRFEFLKE